MQKLIATILTIPLLAFADNGCNGNNSYEINQCLKSKMQKYDKKLNAIKDYNIKEFQKYRNNICTDISSNYTGTYQGIKYGNCIISLDKWYLQQIKI